MVKDQGFTIMAMYTPAELKRIRSAIYVDIEKYPEYDTPRRYETNFVGGGIDRFANPGSFHCTSIRKLRADLLEFVTPLFRNISDNRQKINLEPLVDCLSLAPKGSITKRQPWNIASTPSQEGDEIYNGYFNIGPDKQFFSCVPKTQKDYKSHSAFIKQSDSMAVEKFYKPLSKTFLVPPGSLLLYSNNLVCKVDKKEQTIQNMRLYCGWRLTKSVTPLYDNTSAFENQGVPVVSSGQIPVTYSQLSLAYHKKEIIRWSFATFQPQCLVTRISKKDNKHYTMVIRHMPSLKELDLPMYPPYTEEEKNNLKPHPLFLEEVDHTAILMETIFPLLGLKRVYKMDYFENNKKQKL